MDILSLSLAKKYTDNEIAILKNIGRMLSNWDCTTGMPDSEPPSALPYAYKTGDYYRISKVAASGGTNYKPNGASYTGTASTTVESNTVTVDDIYVYDGTEWLLKEDGTVPYTVTIID